MIPKNHRKSIRHLIKNILTAGIPEVTDRVFTNRFTKTWELECPLIMIYTTEEAATLDGEAPKTLERTLSVMIEVLAKGSVLKESPEIDDQLDDLSQKIEDIMDQNMELGGLCSDSVLTKTTYAADAEGANEFAAVKMQYDVTYRTEHFEVEDPSDLDDFEKAHTKYEAKAGGDLPAEAEDQQTLPTL